jgi:hypothetical protein
MNPTCAYCGDNPVHYDYNETCQFCIYQCSTCGADTPYEDGVSSSSECGTCDLSFGVVADFNNNQTSPETNTTQQQGDTQMKNTLYTVVGFDDETQVYQVVGTTTSDIDPADMVELLGKQTEPTNFDNVIADFINAEVENMVVLATSKERAKSNGMTRAEHKPVAMRMGEWRSLIFALEQIDQMEVRPQNDINNGVNVNTLIDIIKSSLENTQAVVGNA